MIRNKNTTVDLSLIIYNGQWTSIAMSENGDDS